METVKWIFASHIEKNYHKNEDISHSYSDICKATDCFFSAVLMWFFSLDDALSLYCYLMQPFLIFILWSSYESIYFACHIVCAFVFFFYNTYECVTLMPIINQCECATFHKLISFADWNHPHKQQTWLSWLAGTGFFFTPVSSYIWFFDVKIKCVSPLWLQLCSIEHQLYQNVGVSCQIDTGTK